MIIMMVSSELLEFVTADTIILQWMCLPLQCDVVNVLAGMGLTGNVATSIHNYFASKGAHADAHGSLVLSTDAFLKLITGLLHQDNNIKAQLPKIKTQLKSLRQQYVHASSQK